jgi:hypothetical protein
MYADVSAFPLIGTGENGVHFVKNFLLHAEESFEVCIILGECVLPAFHHRLLDEERKTLIVPYLGNQGNTKSRIA